MCNSDLYIPNLDFDSIKSYIRKVMSDKKITQNDISEVLMISQSNVSAYLKPGSGSIPLENFFKICYYLGISMDEVTGLSEYRERQKDISLADILEKIVALDSLCHWGIAEYIREVSYCIYTENSNIINMLIQYAKVRSLNDNDILEMWIAKYKKEHEDHLKKYDFTTKNECKQKLKNWWEAKYESYISLSNCGAMSPSDMQIRLKKDIKSDLNKHKIELLNNIALDFPDSEAFKYFLNLNFVE